MMLGELGHLSHRPPRRSHHGTHLATQLAWAPVGLLVLLSWCSQRSDFGRARARGARCARRDVAAFMWPCSHAIPVYGMMDAQNRNTRYGETDPSITLVYTAYTHTDICPPKYSGRHIVHCASSLRAAWPRCARCCCKRSFKGDVSGADEPGG